MEFNIKNPKLLYILLVEDSDADAILMVKSLEKHKLLINLLRVKDGEEAIAYLSKKEPFSSATTPDLIFLDLNLPKITGFDVLNFIRENHSSSLIPVVILSASEADQDIIKSYNLRANAYVTKPVDFAEFQRAVHALTEFWFTVVKIPPKVVE